MAITIPTIHERRISLGDYMDLVESSVDLLDEESLANSASELKALANNPDVVVDALNASIRRAFEGDSAHARVFSAQTVTLGRRAQFYVRANIWPSAADLHSGGVFQNQFAYDIAHDHSYRFVTAVQFGPGYETEIWEYDHSRLVGLVGEKVPMTFLEKVTFGRDAVMLYRPSRDIHVQRPPQSMTITLNLMTEPLDNGRRDQFYFDLEQQTVIEHPVESRASLRAQLIRNAAAIGNAATVPLLEALTTAHWCQRTRWAATESLCDMLPSEAEYWLTRAADDPAPYVHIHARRRLGALGGHSAESVYVSGSKSK